MEKVLEHYLGTGPYTFVGAYVGDLCALPDKVPELGELVTRQIIHRVTLLEGNSGANQDKRYGDMERWPWYRLRCEDDVFLTASAMLAELYRLDGRGLVPDRAVENKLVVTCRYVAVLMAAILKAKGVPCRCRAGFAPYFDPAESGDHWVNEYWDRAGARWVTFDADGLYDAAALGFDPYDIPKDAFEYAADVWLGLRSGGADAGRYTYAGGWSGLDAAVRAVFYDFHALMNHEISYLFLPMYVADGVRGLSERELCEIDELCRLMQRPDENFEALVGSWQAERKFRTLVSPLVSGADHK